MCREFTQSVRNLALRVGARRNGRKLEDCMVPLREYYRRPETGERTRAGVLCLLERIQYPEQADGLLSVQEQLIRANVAKGMPGNQELYSFFDMVFMKPQSADYLLYLVCSIYEFYQEKTFELLIRLLNIALPDWGLPGDCPPEVTSGTVDLFLRMLQNLVGNSNDMFFRLCRIFEDREFTMLPTSGDEHMGGFRPYFVARQGMEWVYKPRDMRADFFTLEMIRFANTIFPQELQLPEAEIILLEEHTGLMDSVIHAEEMAEDRVPSYFRKLGALFCLAKLLGISDLHEENVMATAEGPVIIDAECAFLLSIVELKDFSDLLFGRIIHAFNEGILCNATFRVGKKVPAFYSQSAYFCEGYQTAAQCLQGNMDAVLAKYMVILKRAVSIRIVPVPTGEFYRDIYSYFTDSASRAQMILSRKEILLSGIWKILYCAHFLSSAQQEALDEAIKQEKLKPDILENALADDFYYGQIPLLRLCCCLSGPCQVTVDGKSFWEVTEQRSPKQIRSMLMEVIRWMAAPETYEIVRQKAEGKRNA